MPERDERPLARDEELLAAVRSASKGGRLACAAALALAGKLGRKPREVGQACDALGVKITSCQLGCFGGGPGRDDATEEV